jgi:site-specific DNA-methyltransferase (adenine-specific)
MKRIPDKSIDMVLSDLPYNCLECKWDVALDLAEFWAQTNRVIKDNGAIVLTATIKFAIDLINSNKKYFRYDLVWHKNSAVGFANCNKMPMRSHELILLFYRRLPVYNPQGIIPVDKPRTERKHFADRDYAYPARSLSKPCIQRYKNYPRSVMNFTHNNSKTIHPTQKPLEMFKYLILTYSNPGDVVLDMCMGSGTTAVAAVETGRKFLGFEMDEGYFRAAEERVKAMNS